MANTKTKDGTYIIDTAAAALVTTDSVKVKSVRWEGGTTAGHQAIIKNASGEVLWQSRASGAQYVESELIERWWNGGFAVTTLQSGVLYISVM